MMEILVVPDKRCNCHVMRHVLEAVALVNASQSYFFLRLHSDPIQLEAEHSGIEWLSAVEQLEEAFQNQCVICITDQRFTDNWFSHDHRRCSIITTADWESRFAPPSLRCYLTYGMAQALIPLVGNLSEEMLLRLAHEPPVGCVHDLCRSKPDIKYGMRAGCMCPICEATLREYGIDPSAIEAIQRILGVVRSEAIGRPVIIDPRAAFVVMRFSQNDENDNAYLHGISPGLQDVGLEARRLDDVIQSGQILDKLIREMKRCRFVVVKVDAENLNVYFELGLAMGLNKDVLLISESEWVKSLPSDLRNWECLTYTSGNYEQLRELVANFFATRYHLERSNSKK